MFGLIGFEILGGLPEGLLANQLKRRPLQILTSFNNLDAGQVPEWRNIEKLLERPSSRSFHSAGRLAIRSFFSLVFLVHKGVFLFRFAYLFRLRNQVLHKLPQVCLRIELELPPGGYLPVMT